MSTFDNPFDPNRSLRAGGCNCGQHVSEAEHERAALALRCEPAPSEDKRYEGVVASAVMRAMFPKDVARRAFLKSVGASPALAAEMSRRVVSCSRRAKNRSTQPAAHSPSTK